MGVFKCKETGTWYVMTRYRDWKGERKQKCKRGFATKRAAQDWEQKFHMQNAADMDMTFEAFYEIYTKDMKARLKENSWITKQNIVETKILPYFGQRKISEITTKDVIAWQNEQLTYRDEKHKPRRISRRCTTSSVPSSITPCGFTICGQIPHQRPEIWATRNAGRCCSGRKRNTRSLPPK